MAASSKLFASPPLAALLAFMFFEATTLFERRDLFAVFLPTLIRSSMNYMVSNWLICLTDDSQSDSKEALLLKSQPKPKFSSRLSFTNTLPTYRKGL